MILTYKFRLKDNHARPTLHRFARAINQVWNFCVETQRKVQVMNKQGTSQRWPSHYDLQKLTAGTSNELAVNSKSIESTCEQFARSRDQHGKCPKFRASGGPRRTLGWIPFPQRGRQINGNSITYLGKTYRFFGTDRRQLPTVVKGGAFVEDARGKWWVCLHVEVSNLPTGAGEVGIDLGLHNLATISDSEKIAPPGSYRQLEVKLATAQRAGNRSRAKAIHVHIANQRKDYLHKASAKLAGANRLIVVGNVNAAGLAKTRMAKSVLDAGWSSFRHMLRYKASRHGATYREVDERLTTQTCSRCGDCASSGRPRGIAGLGIREWVCSSCGASHDRDVNAARNILALGRSAAPRVDESRRIAKLATNRIGTQNLIPFSKEGTMSENRSQWEANKETIKPLRQGPLNEGDVAEPAHQDERMAPVIPTGQTGK